jgi:large subunit ribosomal protein L4
MLRGGGRAHGPKPRSFATGLQKKVYDLAWRTALSYRYRKGELIIVDNAMELEMPSASLLRWVFDNNKWGQRYGRSILVTLQDRPLLAKALEDAPKEGWTGKWNEVDVKDILTTGRVVIERPALKNILLSHQDDLVDLKFPPKLSKSLEPFELRSALGWSEFQRLETAPEEERPELQIALFERVANKRLAQAMSLPSPQAVEHQMSAYNLLSEAKSIEADQAELHPDLEHEESEDESLFVKASMKRIEVMLLREQQCRYQAQALELQGKEEAADWERDADYWRDEAATRQQLLDEQLGLVAEETAEEKTAEQKS